MDRDSFVFYRSFFTCIKEMPEGKAYLLFMAICNYALNGIEPELSGLEAGIFAMMKPQIDANNKKYINGAKGGRPKNQEVTEEKPNHNLTITKAEPNENLNVTKPEPNVNENVNVNVNDNINNVPLPPVESRPAYPYEDIIDYLNQKAGTHFRHSSADTKKHIRARFNDGFKIEDFETVIDKKVKEWKGTDMEKFLRPATLFGTKFEGYLNQKESAVNKPKWQHSQQNDYDFNSLEEQLLSR